VVIQKVKQRAQENRFALSNCTDDAEHDWIIGIFTTMELDICRWK
jgi:hypothetical protein